MPDPVESESEPPTDSEPEMDEGLKVSCRPRHLLCWSYLCAAHVSKRHD